ncbi:hypothetical protein D3C84_1244120 [compost metagenome]
MVAVLAAKALRTSARLWLAGLLLVPVKLIAPVPMKSAPFAIQPVLNEVGVAES